MRPLFSFYILHFSLKKPLLRLFIFVTIIVSFWRPLRLLLFPLRRPLLLLLRLLFLGLLLTSLLLRGVSFYLGRVAFYDGQAGLLLCATLLLAFLLSGLVMPFLIGFFEAAQAYMAHNIHKFRFHFLRLA